MSQGTSQGVPQGVPQCMQQARMASLPPLMPSHSPAQMAPTNSLPFLAPKDGKRAREADMGGMGPGMGMDGHGDTGSSKKSKTDG